MAHSNDRPGSPGGKDRIAGQPDVNVGAPRPVQRADAGQDRPDMDRPPAASRRDPPGFDQATAAEEAEARSGTLPNSGPRHTAEHQRAISAAEAVRRDRESRGESKK